MGKIFLEYLSGPKIYECAACHTHLADSDQIVSKSFQGRQGRAYLFETVANVSQGESEKRRLITGWHIVVDIHCNRCHSIVGWKYEEAFEENQKYKEGKFIIEKAMVVKQSAHAQDDWS
eukprot:TRINITY_DN1991_c0_g2_i1.p1 TRINITY_DN1991_c0_g2~~TRINITY_DN1991_c0_g2_i1.p1  ORF type:complete len:119 (-),score=27.15 TRINITY_DN1991_c0_g2_i1:499-855(-)